MCAQLTQDFFVESSHFAGVPSLDVDFFEGEELIQELRRVRQASARRYHLSPGDKLDIRLALNPSSIEGIPSDADEHIRRPLTPEEILTLGTPRHRHPVAHTTASESLPIITVRTPIQVGEYDEASSRWRTLWSHTWEADLAPCASEPSRSFGVVVKIFQEALAREFEYDVRGMASQSWPTAMRRARQESCAYRMMSVLQGRVLPWSYGFYRVLLPNGEFTYCHVMERLEPRPVLSLDYNLPGQQLDRVGYLSFAERLIGALEAIHRLNFLHTNLHTSKHSSIVVVPGEDGPRPVILDFDFSRWRDASPREYPDEGGLLRHDPSIRLDVAKMRLLLHDLNIPKTWINEWWRATCADKPIVWWSLGMQELGPVGYDEQE